MGGLQSRLGPVKTMGWTTSGFQSPLCVRPAVEKLHLDRGRVPVQLVLTRTDLLPLNTSASTLQSSDNHLQLRPDDLEQELFESYTISFPNCSSLWWSPPFHFNVSRSLFHLQSSLLIGFDAAVVVGMAKRKKRQPSPYRSDKPPDAG